MTKDHINIEFRPLGDVPQSELIELMNNQRLRQHLPLARGDFDEAACNAFLHSKEKLWDEYGFGPWAFVIGSEVAGWGGLQPELGDAEIALVLHPAYWGWGKRIYDQIIQRAFGEMGFESVTVLLPPSRTRIKGILRLGFKPDGEVKVESERFMRYRLHKASE